MNGLVSFFSASDIVINELGKYINPIDLYSLKITCKAMNNIISVNIINHLTYNKFMERLHNMFGEKLEDIIKQFNFHNAWISGSYILQCIIGTHWESDIDIYAGEQLIQNMAALLKTKVRADYTARCIYGTSNFSSIKYMLYNNIKIQFITLADGTNKINNSTRIMPFEKRATLYKKFMRKYNNNKEDIIEKYYPHKQDIGYHLDESTEYFLAYLAKECDITKQLKSGGFHRVFISDYNYQEFIHLFSKKLSEDDIQDIEDTEKYTLNKKRLHSYNKKFKNTHPAEYILNCYDASIVKNFIGFGKYNGIYMRDPHAILVKLFKCDMLNASAYRHGKRIEKYVDRGFKVDYDSKLYRSLEIYFKYPLLKPVNWNNNKTVVNRYQEFEILAINPSYKKILEKRIRLLNTNDIYIDIDNNKLIFNNVLIIPLNKWCWQDKITPNIYYDCKYQILITKFGPFYTTFYYEESPENRISSWQEYIGDEEEEEEEELIEDQLDYPEYWSVCNEEKESEEISIEISDEEEINISEIIAGIRRDKKILDEEDEDDD